MDKLIIIDKTEDLYLSAKRDAITFGGFCVSAWFAFHAGGFFTAILGIMFLIYLFSKSVGSGNDIVREFHNIDDAITHLNKLKERGL